MKNITLQLPIFKQGDDFQNRLDDNKGDILLALQDYEGQLSTAAEMIKNTREILEKYPKQLNKIDISGQTHMIWVNGPDKIMDELVKADLGQDDVFDEE